VLENIKKVSNPLTIIAIFAGLAEVGGTAVLPFIIEKNQSVFLWFVMLFPVLLVILFFLTLNFNHKVLYAPSDYRTDEGFLTASNFKNSEIITDNTPIQGIRFEPNAVLKEVKK